MKTRPEPIRPMEKEEALARFVVALSYFRDVSFHACQQVGAMIEAFQLYCDSIRDHDPDLWNDACREAARLHDIRMETDSEYLRRKGELMRQIEDMTRSPLVLPKIDPETS